jgi:hypothetical protein
MPNLQTKHNLRKQDNHLSGLLKQVLVKTFNHEKKKFLREDPGN